MFDFGKLFLCGTLLWGVAGCESSKAEKQRLEKERLDTKRLDDFYEGEWVKCVNDLGMDRCRIIQETGFRQCKNHRTAGGTSDVVGCMDERFRDRFIALPKEEAPPLPIEAPEAPEAPIKENF